MFGVTNFKSFNLVHIVENLEIIGLFNENHVGKLSELSPSFGCSAMFAVALTNSADPWWQCSIYIYPQHLIPSTSIPCADWNTFSTCITGSTLLWLLYIALHSFIHRCFVMTTLHVHLEHLLLDGPRMVLGERLSTQPGQIRSDRHRHGRHAGIDERVKSG